jgi:hypothetical protein
MESTPIRLPYRQPKCAYAQLVNELTESWTGLTMAGLHYSAGGVTPVGPFSLAELRQMRASGTIADDTPVTDDGGTTWTPFLDYVGRVAHAGSEATWPPQSHQSTTEDAIREQIASTATRFASVGAATARIVQSSFLQTFRSASTVGEKLVAYSSLTGVIAFLMPWIGAFGRSATGFDLARQASGLLWFLPLSFSVCFVFAYLNTQAQPEQRILRARWHIVVGTAWAAASLILTIAGRRLFGIASVGLYLTLASSASLAVGGFLQIGENIKRAYGGLRE